VTVDRGAMNDEEPTALGAPFLGFPDLGAVDPFLADGAAETGRNVGAQSGRAHTSTDARSSFGPAISINGSDPDGPDTDQAADEPWRVTRLAYGRHIRVLLIESDAANADAFTRAADESVLDVRVEHVDDADSAVARLERSVGPLLRKPLPDVVVVSLDMPDTHRLLEMLRDDARFDGLPMIVLAANASPQAERRSFALGATAHLVAPRQDYERVALVHALPDFMPRARAAHAHLESHRR
jgi:CheY-like chemotaxis protein